MDDDNVVAKARKIFLIALPFIAIFWGLGFGLLRSERTDMNWFNMPLIIAIGALIVWLGGLLVAKVKNRQSS